MTCRSLRRTTRVNATNGSFRSATVEAVERRLLLATFTVINTNDTGVGSLRQAIVDANALGGLDTIAFNIPGAGVKTISPTSPLPAITNNVSINGTTQPGYTTTPLIQIDGINAVSGNLLQVNTTGFGLSALAIIRSRGHGVKLEFNGNLIFQCRIGIDAGGNVRGNLGDGINIASSNNFIGIDALGQARGNVISGNVGSGIEITPGSSNAATGNKIGWNLIGTNPAGTAALPNGAGGLVVNGDNTVIGTPTARNVISGNNLWNLAISSDNNVLENNYVGTNAAGTAALGGAGISLGGTNNTVGGTTAGAGNVISGNNYGIYSEGSGFHFIRGNRIGTDAAGTAAVPNSSGLVIRSRNNIIGGTTAAARNVISGNTLDGIVLQLTGAVHNVMQGNHIGTSLSGSSAIPNGRHGVNIELGSFDNFIGGMDAGSRNVISGNSGSGIRITGNNDPLFLGRNQVLGNYVGVNAAGSGAVANGGHGILLEGNAHENTIGGGSAGAGNVISGNTAAGVRVVSNQNAVVGNLIGTNAAGTAAVPNLEDGVAVSGVGNAIGSAGTGIPNTISGNRQSGVEISGSGVSSNFVLGNYIGTNRAGTGAIANLQDGVFIGSRDNTVTGNVISGNAESGVEVFGPTATGNRFYSNRVGTDATGEADLGNALNGVLLESNGNIVGGDANRGNLISGNGRSGVSVFNGSDNTIVANRIGTKTDGVTALGNTQWGVGVNGGTSNHIGATEDFPGLGNTIAFNGLDGVVVVNATNVTVLGNAIFSNAGLGIDLGDDGVSLNDAGDPDAGPNAMQNFPVLASASTFATGTAVQGTLNSTPNVAFRIEFFSNPSADASGHGQGRTYLGSTQVLTNAAGNASFLALLPVPVPSGSFISATASGGVVTQDGYTSEFSAAITAVIDVTPPTVNQSEFLFDLPQPAGAPHRLRYAFSENVSQSLEADDLRLENLTTGQTIAAANFALAYDMETNAATFTFPGFSVGVLPDGRYRATLLAAGVTDPTGNALSANHISDFFVLAGDANHDRRVNLADFNVLAANFGQSNRTFSQGDFNYDRRVNLQDFNILASRFGREIGPATGNAAPGRTGEKEELSEDLNELLG